MPTSSGLFGAPIGQMAYDENMARNAMAAASLEKVQQAREMAPFMQMEKGARAQFLGTRALDLQRKALIDQQVAATMRGVTPGGSDALPGDNARVAGAAFSEAGDVEKGIKLAHIGSQMDREAAAADTNRVRQDLMAMRTRVGNLGLLSQTVRGATDAVSLQERVQEYERRTKDRTGLLDPEGQLVVPYSDRLRDEIVQRSVSESARATADWRESALKSAEKERKSKQSHRDFLEDVDKQKVMADAKRGDRTKKAGGDPLALKSEDVKAGTDFIKSKFVDIDDTAARVLGRTLEEKAKQLKQGSPAMTMTEAREAVYKKMKEARTFETLSEVPHTASPDNPLEIPPRREDLKKGEFYSDGKAVRQWLGDEKGWSGARAVTGKIGGLPPAAASDETEQEDDALALEGDEEEED